MAISDWQAKRRSAARQEIVDAAWSLAREHGLAGLSLRDVARHVGMAAPSLYSYFDSKNALFDAMFADGNRAILAMEWPKAGKDVRGTLRNTIGFFVRQAVADPVRHQLLAERTIPGFAPSEESYALAGQVYGLLTRPLEEVANPSQDDLDLITTVITGLINQHLANDPGGSRWVRLIDDAADLLVPRLEARAKPTTRRRRQAMS
ncbi:TetR/AcrR family transcriptional regulator [Tenggerimyces flavus]|uniref:TetR/AcrR family transcriptional regulator n=1 Tax=Tenggerimyces flavus TaxID=1708749 RepID=A0ABV7YH25_9ACTN|nr:TetR/AcrR family transcriptional regulator [Tenggerimyces flavus]MBM7790962.1 AcrR family transcriptional regulator [Tenggerimyces flavus]